MKRTNKKTLETQESFTEKFSRAQPVPQRLKPAENNRLSQR
jgi:hypothetical protein